MPYIFDPDILHKIANKSMGLPYEQMFETVRVELEQKYPGRINDKIQWMFNNAGGCMYSVAVLHASLTEYILIFGSPIGTKGHTGRHFTEIYDFVIDGELWYFKENRPFERIVRKSGDRYYLEKSQSEGLSIPEQAWVLEYARGFIPSMLPFGLADSFFSTLDLKTVARTFGIYGKLLLKNYWKPLSGNSLPSAPKEMP
ncbi:ERG2 family protein [Calothrix rhizosoleniae]|uniref:ERG2 family protein n=1 Tax=Calothrix rhizosoleniae TaxID=888997 RepID=UPI000B49ED11|nr:ERG2 family protein [Calothrix rhizosoleniae]